MQTQELPGTLVPIGKACSIVGRSPRTLRAWVADKRLTEYRDDRGHRYFALADLERLRPKPIAAATSEGAA